jgi:hypothetical protein
MANFTDTELEGAVTKFVREDVKTERTDLGPLSTEYTFSEVREFVASTLVFDPSAIFYLLSLAANRVNQDVLQALEYLEDVIVAIEEVGGDTTTVSQTSLLEDAAAALIEVERTIEVNNAITARPFARYQQALDTFTDKSLTPNVRRLAGTFPNTYEVVRPPQKAQASIKTNIAELRDLHEAIIEEATQLTLSLSEFLAANLPLAAIQNTVPKVRKDLRDLKSQFDAASRDGAIEITRDAFLSIQAGRSVVTNLTSISDPREERMKSTATSSDRAQAVYPCLTATPAEVTSEKGGPYLITSTTNKIFVNVDGAGVQTATLEVPDRASLSGDKDESYDIYAASTKAKITSGSAGPYTVPAAPNNVFDVFVDGIGYRATLTTGSRTAAQLVAEINPATRIDGGAGTFGAVATALDTAGTLELEHDTAGDNTISLGSEPALNPALGFTDGESDTGVQQNNELRLIHQSVLIAVVTLTAGVGRTATQVAADIDANPYLVGDTDTITTTTGSITVVKITSDTDGEASHLKIQSLTAAQEAAAETLGLYEDQEDRGEFLPVRKVKDALDLLSGIEVELDETELQSGSGGTTVYTGSYILRLPVGTITATVIPGVDMLRITNGENLGWYQISSFTPGGAFDEIAVTRAFPATSGLESQNQAWEIHRRLFTIRSLSSDTDSQIDVDSGLYTAHIALGLSTVAVLGTVSGVRIKDGSKFLNFSREDVVAGDQLTLRGPTYTTVHTVTDVTYDGYQIEVTPEVKNDLAAHEYQVDGEGAIAYKAFDTALSNWFTNVLEASKFEEDILELERVLNPLLVNKNPSAALVGTAKTTAENLRKVYSNATVPLGLSEILEDFTTSPVSRIDSLLDMLQERGMDRAHELLLLGKCGPSRRMMYRRAGASSQITWTIVCLDLTMMLTRTSISRTRTTRAVWRRSTTCLTSMRMKTY